MIEAGKYRGTATELAWDEKTFEGDTKVIAVVKFDTWPEGDEHDAAEPFELTWTGYFSDKAKDITLAQLKQCGFEGAAHEVVSMTLADLNKEVTLKVSYKEWRGDQQMRVSIVTPYVGKPASKSALDKLSASLKGVKSTAAPQWNDDDDAPPFG